MATQTASNFNLLVPRAVHVGENRMANSIVAQAPVSASASDELFMFPLPPNCLVTGGAIKGSVPSGTIGNVIIKLGTRESDAAFGTYTLSGTAVLATRLAIYSPVTVSTSDDLVPYQRAVIATIASGTTSTTSFSLYVLLEYVMPGNV